MTVKKSLANREPSTHGCEPPKSGAAPRGSRSLCRDGAALEPLSGDQRKGSGTRPSGCGREFASLCWPASTNWTRPRSANHRGARQSDPREVRMSVPLGSMARLTFLVFLLISGASSAQTAVVLWLESQGVFKPSVEPITEQIRSTKLVFESTAIVRFFFFTPASWLGSRVARLKSGRSVFK